MIITADSRTLVGKLLSCDQMTNLVSQPYSSATTYLRATKSPPWPIHNLRTNTLLPRQVLGQTIERVIRDPDDHEDSEEVQLGLYLVRGDNVCLVGLVDEALDESINWGRVKGSAIGGIKHI